MEIWNAQLFDLLLFQNLNISFRTEDRTCEDEITFSIEEYVEQGNSLLAMLLVVDWEQFVEWDQSLFVELVEFFDGVNIAEVFETVLKVKRVNDVQIFWFVEGHSGLVWMLQQFEEQSLLLHNILIGVFEAGLPTSSESVRSRYNAYEQNTYDCPHLVDWLTFSCILSPIYSQCHYRKMSWLSCIIAFHEFLLYFGYYIKYIIENKNTLIY